MSARLTTPNDDLSIQHVLNPDVAEATLEGLWSKAASCLIQLSRLTFPRIGALVEVEVEGEGAAMGDGESNGERESKANGEPNDATRLPGSRYAIAGRPLTHNMTDMLRLAHIPRSVLPPEETTYPTADAWYAALADMHLAQLVFQHNDAASSPDDCRNKYVARQLFRRLARQGRLSTFGFAEDSWSAQARSSRFPNLAPAPAGDGAFRLWGDDLRAGNMLLSETDELVGVIDWEFAYAAPTQFALDPPWWLLLNLAETWEDGVEEWVRVYEGRLGVWMAAVERAEESDSEGGGGEGVAGAVVEVYARELGHGAVLG
jgi:hypothetical protein